jgi:hypothetical protein
MARIHSLPNRWEPGLTGATGLISQKENDKDSFFIPFPFYSFFSSKPITVGWESPPDDRSRTPRVLFRDNRIGICRSSCIWHTINRNKH